MEIICGLLNLKKKTLIKSYREEYKKRTKMETASAGTPWMEIAIRSPRRRLGFLNMAFIIGEDTPCIASYHQ